MEAISACEQRAYHRQHCGVCRYIAGSGIGLCSVPQFLGVIPLLVALACGYVTAICFNMVDFTPILNTKLFTIPHFTMAKFDVPSMLTIAPVALVLAAEHIGHQIVTGEIVGRDLLKDPGLHRSYFADNFSTAISGLLGAVGTTTYGENIGVMAITGVYSVQVIGGAACISILMAFVGPLSALISTIPGDVIGGITFALRYDRHLRSAHSGGPARWITANPAIW